MSTDYGDTDLRAAIDKPPCDTKRLSGIGAKDTPLHPLEKEAGMNEHFKVITARITTTDNELSRAAADLKCKLQLLFPPDELNKILRPPENKQASASTCPDSWVSGVSEKLRRLEDNTNLLRVLINFL